jgi:hypothetical protein
MWFRDGKSPPSTWRSVRQELSWFGALQRDWHDGAPSRWQQRRQRDDAASVPSVPHSLELLDLQRHPSPTHDATNNLLWHGSAAQHFLFANMDLDKHTTMQSKDLYATRPEYAAFSLKVFRKHIEQEVRKRKFIAQCRQKNQRV